MSTPSALTITASRLVVPILAGAILWLIARWLRKAKPLVVSDQDHGTIAPDKVTAWLTVLAGLGMAGAGGVGVVALIQDAHPTLGHWLIALAIVALGLTIAGFMAPSLTSFHRVRWTDASIEGPAETFGLTLGLRRCRIAWAEIARTGLTATGYWYVEARDGRRVFWSYLYRGNGALLAALAKHRPDVKTPNRPG